MSTSSGRPNRFPGSCVTCGGPVAAYAGDLVAVAGKLRPAHKGTCPSPVAAHAAAPARTFDPTPEQLKVVEAFRTGLPLVVEAGAGAGKTSTLVLLGEDAKARGLRGQYVAFNRAIVKDAAEKMPSNVSCNTMHSLAFKAVGKPFAHRIGSQRMRSDQIARMVKADPFIVSYGEQRKVIQPSQIGGLVMRAVLNFCASTDTEPGEHHVPYVEGIDIPTETGERTWENNRQLRRHLVGAVRRAWADQCDPNGQLPYKPDAYLKVWALGDPKIDADFILFDEGQDADPVQLQIVLNQKQAQLVIVGDSQQAIYGWRGAVDALAKVREQGGNVAWLTQSFRFGPAVAEVANGLLGRLGAELRIVGTEAIASTVVELDEPDCILTRTNAKAVTTVMTALAAGRQPALVGGAKDVVMFAKAAQALMAGTATSHPDLACFETWAEVQAYVQNDEQGGDLRLLVKLVEDFGVEAIITALDATVDEKSDRCDLVVSTAHKAKGREWASVQLASDFRAPKAGGDLPAEELRLLYVAVTRARRELDISKALIAVGLDDDGESVLVPDEDGQMDETALELTLRFGTRTGK